MAQQEGDESNRLDTLPIVLQAAGRHAEADETLKTLATKYADTDAYFVAMNYAYQDDHDLALTGSNVRTNRRTVVSSKSPARRGSRTWRTTLATRHSCGR